MVISPALSSICQTFQKNIQKILIIKIVSEYDQEVPQSQTANNPKAPRGRATQPSGDTRETN